MDLPTFDPGTCGACCGAERADAAAHRARLLEVARSLFEERGIAEVSMRDVACAAGVGQGTLYRKFPSKGALAAALLADAVITLQTTLQQVVDDAPEAPADAFLLELVRFTAAHHALLAEAICSIPDGLHLGNTPIWCWKQAALAELLSAQYPQGGFPADRAAEILIDAQRPDRIAQALAAGRTPTDVASELGEVARRLMA